MNPLFKDQLEEARSPSGEIDVDMLAAKVGSAYDEAANELQLKNASIEKLVQKLRLLDGSADGEAQRHIDDLQERQSLLVVENNRFNVALAHMGHGLAMFDSQKRLVLSNQCWKEIYNIPANMARPGVDFADVIRQLFDAGCFNVRFDNSDEFVTHILERIENPESPFGLLKLSDGRMIDVKWQPTQDGGWVSTHEDVTKRLEAEQKVAYLACHDPLTELPNRTEFLSRVNEALEKREDNKIVAVHYLDLNRFKSINENLGHTVGDALLQSVATRLKSCLQDQDLVARLGGDEFAIVQTGIADPGEAAMLAQQICRHTDKPFDVEGHIVKAEVNLGVAFGPKDGANSVELLKLADLALHRAKGDSGSSYRFYEPEMDAHLKVRRELEIDLRHASESDREQFEVYFQPIVDMSRKEISSCEALVRWRHPEKGLIPPSDFIPMAEEIGVIGRIGEWVLNEACRHAVQWPETVKVSINVSPTQLATGNLVSQIIDIIRTTQLAPERIEVEMTEEMLVQNPEVAVKTLRMLSNIDVRIALDDFGTGYSSLIYLCRYPFDKIKIDRSFVASLPNREPAAIISSITGLARSLDMITTAEGIETETQLKQVRALGCTEAQGYLISQPVPADEMTRMLTPKPSASNAVA